MIIFTGWSNDLLFYKSIFMPYYIGFDFPIFANDMALLHKNLVPRAVEHIKCNIEKHSKIWLFKETYGHRVPSHIDDIKTHYADADRNSAYIIFRVNILRNTNLSANFQEIPIEQILSVQAIAGIYLNRCFYYPGMFFFSSIEQEKMTAPIEQQIEIITAPQKIEELKRSIKLLCRAPRYENTKMDVKFENLINALVKVEDIMTRKKILLAIEALIKKANQNRLQSNTSIRSSIEYNHLKYFTRGPRDRENRLLVRGGASCELMMLGFLIAVGGLLVLLMYNDTVKISAPVSAAGVGLFAYARRSTGIVRAIEDVIEEIMHSNISTENRRPSTYPMQSV